MGREFLWFPLCEDPRLFAEAMTGSVWHVPIWDDPFWNEQDSASLFFYLLEIDLTRGSHSLSWMSVKSTMFRIKRVVGIFALRFGSGDLPKARMQLRAARGEIPGPSFLARNIRSARAYSAASSTDGRLRRSPVRSESSTIASIESMKLSCRMSMRSTSTRGRQSSASSQYS